MHIEFPDHENSEEYKVTWKIPEELATGLENPKRLEEIKKFTFLSGSYLDENGDRVNSSGNGIHDEKYVKINPSNRTVEYDLAALLEEHSLILKE